MGPFLDRDAERQALIRLQEQLARSRPHGLLARLRRRFELRQIEGVLEWEDARPTRAETAGSYRKGWVYSSLLGFGAIAVQGLFFSPHPLTLARALLVLGGCGAGAGITVWALHRSAPRVADSTERAYLRFLARAKALPAPEEPARTGSLVEKAACLEPPN